MGARRGWSISMTIRARPYLLALPLVALGWIGTLAAVAVRSDAAPAQYAFFPAAHLLDRLPEARILSRGPFWLVLASERPGFARALYAGGAMLVLPAGLRGCLPLPG